ncbi:unannotated protein [freshwater metagenome]|uniref:Unannotated protein n=1 Tax=freshwater metagenome TaxID=449393 RepID=A0A6J5ZW37_9ZZZZ
MTLRVVSEPPAAITVAFAAEAEATKLAATVANAAPTRTTRLNKGLFTAFGSFPGNGDAFDASYRVGLSAHAVIVDMTK